MVFLVTWDLNREAPNYHAARAKLIGRLQQFDHARDSGLDSVWFVSVNGSADALSEDLQRYIDRNDRLFVTKLVRGNHQGWLSQSVWDWINQRI